MDKTKTISYPIRLLKRLIKRIFHKFFLIKLVAEKKFKWKNSTKILVWKNWKRIFHGNIVKRKKILPKVTFNLSQNNYQEIIFYSIKISIELSRLSKRLAITIVEIKKRKEKND